MQPNYQYFLRGRWNASDLCLVLVLIVLALGSSTQHSYRALLDEDKPAAILLCNKCERRIFDHSTDGEVHEQDSLEHDMKGLLQLFP